MSDRKREVLGTGAYATVYAEWDPLLRRSVAIKEVNSPFAQSALFARAFLARAERLFDLEDEHVLAVYRVGDSRNAPAIVRELAAETLAALLATGPMPVEKVKVILYHALQGLQAMHDRGLVHGAVQPQNLFRCGDRIKVGDFGMAAATGAPPAASDRYQAPEVLRGEAASPASDLYSLGRVAYELLLGPAGFEAFAGKDLPPLHELLAGIPMPVSLTLQEMTRKALADRTPNAGQALASLNVESASGSGSSAARSLDDTSAFDARLRSPVATTKRKAQRLKWAIAIVFALLLASFTFAANRFLGEQRPAEHRAPARPVPRDAAPSPLVAPVLVVPVQETPSPQGPQPGAAAAPLPPARAPEPSSQTPPPEKTRMKPPEPRPVKPPPVVTEEPKHTTEVSPATVIEPASEPADHAVTGSTPALPGEIENLIVSLERQSKSAQEAYADEEKPDEALGARLEELVDAATGVRKAWRKANGKGFSAFKDKLLRRSSQEADRHALEVQVKELVSRGSQIDGLLEKIPMGPAAMGYWKEVRRSLKRLEGSFR